MANMRRKYIHDKRPFANDSFEIAAWEIDELVCGIDEVGRGCLAGPVVTAAVILHPFKTSKTIRDSKILTKEELIENAIWIKQNSWYCYSIVDHIKIDQVNIYQATLLAMKRSLTQLLITCPKLPKTILVDAMPLTIEDLNYNIEIKNFTMGEYKSQSIAAASIIAKVKRDEIMKSHNKIFSNYKFNNNKGYGTKTHKNALFTFGPCILHRKTFLKKILEKDKSDEQQKNLFF